jgi:hypothetical protein
MTGRGLWLVELHAWRSGADGHGGQQRVESDGSHLDSLSKPCNDCQLSATLHEAYMFSDIEIAKEVYGHLLEARKILANSVADIKGRCSDEEYSRYRKGIGDALGLLIVDVMAPIQDRHPTVVPRDEAN